MFKTILKTLALSAATLTLLSACGASDALNTAISGDDANLKERGSSGFLSVGLSPIAEEHIQAEYHASGSTLTQVASIRIAGEYRDYRALDSDNYPHDITRSKTQDTFSLRTGEGNTIIMTVNGVEYALIPKKVEYKSDDYDYEINRGYDSKKPSGTGFRGNGNIKEIISGTHATIQGDYVIYSTDTTNYTVAYAGYQGNSTVDYTMGYATIGIQTPASVVDAQTAVATYNGSGYLYTYVGEDDNHIGTWTDVLIAMSVDFDANTIAGTGVSDHWAHTITFNSAPIVGNGFAGTFKMNDRLSDWYQLIDNPTGQYGGNFFGPNADDLAGTLRFDGVAREYDYYGPTRDVDIIGIGGFRADRQ